MRKLLICVAFFSTSSMAADVGLSRKTVDFCYLADEFGYKSRGYKVSSGGCGTPMVEISKPGKNGLGNNLAYYATGVFENPEVLDYASFILNVNNTKAKKSAQEELYRVSREVGVKILDSTPGDFKKVVLEGRTKSWNINDWEINVITTVWPTGQGQDTRIVFSPIKK